MNEHFVQAVGPLLVVPCAIGIFISVLWLFMDWITGAREDDDDDQHGPTLKVA